VDPLVRDIWTQRCKIRAVSLSCGKYARSS